MTPALAMVAGVAVFAGVALGVLHVAALWWNVRLYLAARRGAAVALHALRLVAVAAALWLAARAGAGALLAVAVGFLVAVFVAARAGVR